MRRLLLLGLGLLLTFTAPGARAESPKEFDTKIEAELRAKNAEAADVFVRANEARAREDHATAADLYAEVRAKAPDFIHAERRQCTELAELQQRDRALELCRDAVAKAPEAVNLTALALALSSHPRGSKASSSDLEEAYNLLVRAENADTTDIFVPFAQCQLALERESVVELRDCTSRLDKLAPSNPITAQMSWMLAMSTGRFDDAEAQIERARLNGAPAKMVAGMKAATAEARPWTDKAWYWGWRIVAGWIALSLLLVLAGSVLSGLTLRTAESWTPESARRGATLRTVYRGVLVVCSVLYYASLPLVLLAVIGLAGGLVYGMFVIGFIPIKLGLIAALMVFATATALIKSLTFRPSDEDPGIFVNLSEEPRLRETLNEVAAQIGTRTVDKVFLTPDTGLAVFERKRGERCLVLGAGVLEGLPLPAFKAILAHEYGHFSHRDTAGGGFALSVRRSLLHFIIGLAQSGHAQPWNPAWLFARGFYNIFLRISQGASRLQEILADRRAAEAYGGAAFASGLRHVLTCDLHFKDHINEEIQRALKAKQPLQGLWSPLAARVTDEKQLAEALNREPSPYDSHPAPNDRIRWVEQIAGTAPSATAAEAGDAWSLFQNRAGLEREVTLFVYARLAEAGVHLPALPTAAASTNAPSFP